MTAPASYFEDVVLRGVVETPAITVTEAHAALYGHVAQEPAPAAGWVPDHLVLCLTTGLGWRAPQPPLAVLAFMGFEWRSVAPVAIGDTIRSRSRTVTKRAMREGGVIVEEREVLNQRDEVVQQGRFTFLVARRDPRREEKGS